MCSCIQFFSIVKNRFAHFRFKMKEKESRLIYDFEFSPAQYVSASKQKYKIFSPGELEE